ncbi:unnamed protein product [Parascedosporium putredinis]|uniref:Uncharacterized protein n=1 Tax=Parascedosporium putredinis TaxID=1442378 RepID=A0A9P1GYQ6_9PEZI|nr:unnamed protein product [Parascedosporium putredinis]CAI7990333.1 unnamed protein product [Parascedosporium putredinis]
MKFTHAILAVASLLSAPVLAAPTVQSEGLLGGEPTASQLSALAAHPDSEQIDALFSHITIEGEEQSESPANPLVARGDNYCSPTGAESCNFWIKTTIPIASSGFQRWWGLYSNSCAKIGGSASSLSVTSESWSLSSQLPYTIELTINFGGYTPGGYFWYAGRKTNLGSNMYCESCSGASRCCRVAFQCR